MNAAKGKNSASKVNSIGVKNAKAKFENGMKCQRAPSPAPVSMAARNANNSKAGISSSAISSYKERFELFTAPKSEVTAKPSLRRASSEDNVGKSSFSEQSKSLDRMRSNSAAEGHWFQARTKIYEQLSKKRSQSELGLKNGSTASPETIEKKPYKRKAEERGEIVSLSERINKYKSDVETKKTISEKMNDQSHKPTVHISDIKSSFKVIGEIPEVAHKPAAIGEKHKKGLTDKGTEGSTEDDEKKLRVSKSEKATEKNKNSNIKNMSSKTDSNGSMSRDRVETDNKSINIHKGIQKVIITDVTDVSTARTFMEELIAAIDNKQHVPMKQLIDLFETMKRENGEMKNSIEYLKSKLDKEDLDSLSVSLRQQLSAATAELESAKGQVAELASYREAVRESEVRCEELEELNHQYLEDIEELKLVMNEMRDQFHDDEVHETIILQQRLDDMARSLRIIHFRLKKADAKLQETEREKETLLEEIKLLQRGTFTDEEIRRMQSLEGDLQTAKEISVELHARLQKSEERREKVEQEANQLREEIAATDLENERLRNNILHLREQISEGDNEGVLSPAVKISRQGSSADMDTLKSNLEASIERENDIKEQLSFAEQDAQMLRKRLRDIEHENEALTKQLKRLTQTTSRKGKDLDSSEHIQTEVIQLENAQLRRNNDKLHQDMDSLQAQIKSLRQKLTLVQDEQKEGPLSVSKNSLYYETKFDKMMQEIKDLREQLQEKDADFKRLREETTGQSRRDQFRRAMTIDCDSVDIKKQLDIALQEARQLKLKLEDVERRNEELVNQNRIADGCINNSSNPSTSNSLLAARSESSSLLEENGENKPAYAQNQDVKSMPDIGELARKLQESEEKIASYESQLLTLRRDMHTMESDLKDDINNLTMKNSILRQLLEVISEHDGDEKSSIGGATQHPHVSRQASFRWTADKKKDDSAMENSSEMANSDLGSDTVIAKHISRLPHDIQCHFRKKISYLENQLKEERERSKKAEQLLQQIKPHLRSCVFFSPLSNIMHPRKISKYPQPPPSLLIKPSAHNSPSHPLNKASKLTSSTSTPEKMKMGHQLANHIYLGNTSNGLVKHEVDHEDLLTISIHPTGPPEHRVKTRSQSMLLDTHPVNNLHESAGPKQAFSSILQGQQKYRTTCEEHCELANEVRDQKTLADASQHLHNKIARKRPVEDRHCTTPTDMTILTSDRTDSGPDVRPKETTLNPESNGVVGSRREHVRDTKSTLRKNFFDNYSHVLAKAYKTKKKVSFALPSIERDISDMSISSHLSAVSDCLVLDDDDE